MKHLMGMQTIAEGVERLEQRTFLESIGADSVQGYLYLRPTTAEKFGAWLGPHLAGLSSPHPPATRSSRSGRGTAPEMRGSATVRPEPPTRVTQGKPVRIRR
jgi:predicted signal transduction protein with EAL and GGDEF domain